ncbi:MAG: COG1361 S-layer family protein [Candidatus Methanofastidiosia archaeon]
MKERVKKILMLLIFVSVILDVVQAQEEMFKITAQVPPFVRPGDKNVIISVTIRINDSQDHEDVEAELILPRYFSASKEDSDTYELGDLYYNDPPRPDFGVALFQIDVSENAKYGDYEIQIFIKSKKGSYLDSFDLHVIGNTLVDIESLDLDKQPIEPGDDFSLSIKVRNVGENSLKWLKINLNPNPFEALPTSSSQEIIPISTDLERIFKEVSPGRFVTAIFKLSVSRDAESQNYSMTVTLTYMDEAFQTYSEIQNIGIKVEGNPKVILQSIEADPAIPIQSEEVTISVTLENVGTTEARSVKVNLETDFGTYTEFVGTIKHTESDAAVFEFTLPDYSLKTFGIALKPGDARNHTLTFTVSYEDLDGREVKFEEGWSLSSKPKEDKTLYYLVGGFILFIVILIWRIQSRRRLRALEE